MLAPVILVMGCEPSEQITTYTVPTHDSLQTPEFLQQSAARKPVVAQMLAAVVPHGPDLWFFKLQGPPDAVLQREPEFRALLKSVRFSSTGAAEWTLPSDWQEKPGNEMRYKTLVPPGEPPLEVTVTTLPAGDDLQAGILANINRWRNQLDLPFIQAEDLPSRTEKIEAGELAVTLINIVGKAKPAAAMAGMPPMHPGAPSAGPDKAPGKQAADIQYEKPAEWLPVAPKQFIIAAFTVVDGKKELNITLSRAGGSKTANVNRWRGQMGIGPLDEDEIRKSLKKFPVGSRTGELVEMTSDTQSLVVVLIPDGDQTVFVKLMGDPELAIRERERFEAFAKSVKF